MILAVYFIYSLCDEIHRRRPLYISVSSNDPTTSRTTLDPVIKTTFYEISATNEGTDDESESGSTSPIVISLPRMSFQDIKRLERIAMGIDKRSYLWMLDCGKEEPSVFRKRKTIPEGFAENATILGSNDLTETTLLSTIGGIDSIPSDKLKHYKRVLRSALHEVLSNKGNT